ncbi:Lysophospholipase catalytic domain containing protein [Tylopilus felleus]
MLRIFALSAATWLCLLSLPAWRVAAANVASQAWTPKAGACPEGFSLVRNAGGFTWKLIPARRSQVISQAWKTYLANIEATNHPEQIEFGDPKLWDCDEQRRIQDGDICAGVLNALDGEECVLEQGRFRGIASIGDLPGRVVGRSIVDGMLVTVSTRLATIRSRNAKYLVDLAEELDGKYDAGSNVNNFADGSALIEFTAQNLTTRPTFFGRNTTSDTMPLVIYLANGGPPHNGEVSVTNTDTLQVSYSSSEIQAMLDQIFIISTQGYAAESNETTDPEWPACLACALVDRARQRAGDTRSGVCETCFDRYCWSGSTLT